MCFNGSASLISFVVNLCCSAILTYFNPVLGFFFMFVGVMQLHDLIFWTHHDKNNVNYWTTKIAMVSNHLQPIILVFLVMYIGKRRLKPLTMIIVLVYIIGMGLYSIHAWKTISYTLVHEKTYPSLFWEWNALKGCEVVYILYLATLIIVSWDGFDWPLNILFIGIILGSCILGIQYYKGNTSIGRFWCYFAAYIPLFMVVYFYMQSV